MKPIRTYLVFTVMLAMLAPLLPLNAQQKQDALYIYRNDGGFHGFFFSDIDRIEYSKVDTLGQTQNDYVVQEVYALDSVYRIPLSAIDSVTFITPETVYKKDVAHTTESKLWDYVIGSDSVTVLRLKTSTPSSLIPKKGDKIVTTKSRDYLPGGFYGVVKSVKTESKYITVSCEVPELTELFDQVVFKAAAVGAPKGSNKVRKQSEESTTSEFELPAVTFKKDLGGGGISYDMGNNWSIKGSGSMELGVSHKVNIRAFMAIRWALGMNLDVTQRVETTSWFDLKLSGEVGGSLDLHTYLLNGWKWIPDTPFAIEWEGGFSVGASGKVDLDIHRKHVSSSYLMVQYNDSFYDEEHSQCAASFHTLGTEASTSLSGEVSATAGPYFSVYLSLVKKEVGKVGLRFDAGLKVALAAELNMTDYLLAALPATIPAVMKAKPTALYDYLNRDGSVKFGRFFKCDFEAQLANAKKLKYSKTLYDNFSTPAKAAWIDFEGGLVPKFSSTKLSYNKEKNILTAEAALTRKTLMGNKVGFAAYYTKSGKLATKNLYEKKYSYDGEKASFNKWSQTFNNLHGGKELTIYPVVTLLSPLNYELLASPTNTITIPAEMEIYPETLEFPAEGGKGMFTVNDNLDHIEDNTYKYTADLKYSGKEKWLTGKWDDYDYNLVAEPNTTGADRTCTITFTVQNSDKSVKVQKSVTVTQLGEGYDVSLDRYDLEYTSAQSTQDVALNIDWNTVPFTNVRARVRNDGSQDWIKVKWDGYTCKITALPHFDKKKRTGYVDFYAYKKVDGEVPPESEWFLIGGKPVTVTQGTPIAIKKDMKFLGKWIYENKKDNYYVEYTFGSDGTYTEIWDTKSTKINHKGNFVVNSYSEEENGNVVMEASINIRYPDTDGSMYAYTTDPPIKLIKSSGYVDGKWTSDGLRELQIGWNTYTKAK